MNKAGFGSSRGARGAFGVGFSLMNCRTLKHLTTFTALGLWLMSSHPVAAQGPEGPPSGTPMAQVPALAVPAPIPAPIVETQAAGRPSPPGEGLQSSDDGTEEGLLDEWLRDEDHEGHRSDRVYSLVEESDGRTVTRTALAIGVGDSYIDEDNRLYEVVRIDGNTAYVRFVEEVKLPEVSVLPPRRSGGGIGARFRAGWAPRWPWLAQGNRAAGDNEGAGDSGGRGRGSGSTGSVAIYHSHNAESYVPTSGKEFEEGRGDVHRVGAALKEALEEQGMEVYWSQQLHLPHDGGAYRRSRATVRELLQKRPTTMLDIHRDAIPAEEYMTEVNGEEMTKVRLVVGRQNQNRDANLEYAKRIKAVADKEFPGLVKGIFHARGNYNQDVGPRMMLLEFGSHETSLEHAQRSARLMAQVIPRAAGVEGARDAVGASGWRTAFWLLVLALVGVLAYLRINAGSWEAFFERLQQLGARLRGMIGQK